MELTSFSINFSDWFPLFNPGAIQDCLVGEIELAQYFLAILNLSDEYKKWAKLCAIEKEMLTAANDGIDSEKTQHLTDHTQVYYQF